jgi:hypothetical protein
MKTLQVSPQYGDLAKQNYLGKAVALPTNYPRKYLFQTLMDKIAEQTRIRSGAMFDGELEKYMLDPLFKICDTYLAEPEKAESATEVAHAMAVSFSLISEYATLTQAKDLSTVMTTQMITNSPIYQAISGFPVFAEGADGADHRKALAAEWKVLQESMGSTTPEEALRDFFNWSATTSQLDTSLQSRYQLLMKTAAKGKGYPLTSGRRENMLTKLSTIKSAILQMWNSSGGPSANNYDAITCSYWFIAYLEMASNYDSYFPAQPFQINTQAWAQTITSISVKVASIFSEIATVALSSDINVAISLFSERQAFVEGYIPNNSQFDDMMKQVDEFKKLFLTVENPNITPVVDSAFERLKQFADATHILPRSMGKEDLQPFPSDKAPKEPKDIINKLVTSSAILYPRAERQKIFTSMLNDASKIAAAVDHLTQVKGILSLTWQTGETFRSVIPSLDLPLVAHIGSPANPVVLDYRHSQGPIFALPKYKPGVDAQTKEVEWIHNPSLLVPQLRSVMLKDGITTATSRSKGYFITFRELDTTPLTSVLTKAYMEQPLPFCYAEGRSRERFSYSIDNYLAMLDTTQSDYTPGEHFLNAARIILRHDEDHGNAINNALSAVGSWVGKFKGSGEWYRFKPTIPTIYGMPTQMFLEAQATINDKNVTAALSSGTAMEMRSTTGDSFEYLNEERAFDNAMEMERIVFVMHDKYPKMTKLSFSFWSPTRGHSVLVPVIKSIYDTVVVGKKSVPKPEELALISIDDITGKSYSLGISTKAAFVKAFFTEPEGLIPVQLVAPHYSFDVVHLDSDAMKEWLNTMTSVISKRHDPITKDLILKAFYDDPVIVTDLDDLREAMSTSDPTPSQTATLVTDEDAAGDSGFSSKEGPSSGKGGPDPTPSTLTPESSNEKALSKVASVSQSPTVAMVSSNTDKDVDVTGLLQDLEASIDANDPSISPRLSKLDGSTLEKMLDKADSVASDVARSTAMKKAINAAKTNLIGGSGAVEPKIAALDQRGESSTKPVNVKTGATADSPTEDNKSTLLSGSPSADPRAGDGAKSEEAPASRVKKIYKKVTQNDQGEEVIDFIEIAEGDEVPSGYVPSSKKERDEYDAKNEDNS